MRRVFLFLLVFSLILSPIPVSQRAQAQEAMDLVRGGAPIAGLGLGLLGAPAWAVGGLIGASALAVGYAVCSDDQREDINRRLSNFFHEVGRRLGPQHQAAVQKAEAQAHQMVSQAVETAQCPAMPMSFDQAVMESSLSILFQSAGLFAVMQNENAFNQRVSELAADASFVEQFRRIFPTALFDESQEGGSPDGAPPVSPPTTPHQFVPDKNQLDRICASLTSPFRQFLFGLNQGASFVFSTGAVLHLAIAVRGTKDKEHGGSRGYFAIGLGNAFSWRATRMFGKNLKDLLDACNTRDYLKIHDLYYTSPNRFDALWLLWLATTAGGWLSGRESMTHLKE